MGLPIFFSSGRNKSGYLYVYSSMCVSLWRFLYRSKKCYFCATVISFSVVVVVVECMYSCDFLFKGIPQKVLQPILLLVVDVSYYNTRGEQFSLAVKQFLLPYKFGFTLLSQISIPKIPFSHFLQAQNQISTFHMLCSRFLSCEINFLLYLHLLCHY